MSALSDVLELKFLDHMLGVSSYTAPASVYLGLSTVSGGFGEAGTGAESSLARQSITFAAATHSLIRNASAIEFPRLTGSAEALHGWGVWDAVTGGNLMYYGSFSASTDLNTGDAITVPQNGVSISHSGALQPYAFQSWTNHCLRNISWTMPTSLYIALDRTGATIGPASDSFSVLGGGTFDEPRWHDWSTGTVSQPPDAGTAAQFNAIRRAGVINGANETFGGYQRCSLVYNAATSGSSTLNYSVTRDDGLWYNDQARNSNWDATNSRRQNWGKTELRKWTDRVEWPIAGNFYPTVGAFSTPPYGSGVSYGTLASWSTTVGSNVVTGTYTPTTGAQYGTITGWGIFDAETPQTGNLLLRGTFASSIAATAAKDVVRIPATSFTVTAA